MVANAPGTNNVAVVSWQRLMLDVARRISLCDRMIRADRSKAGFQSRETSV